MKWPNIEESMLAGCSHSGLVEVTMAEKKTKAIKVTLVKSPIGYSVRQKGTVRALGLRRMGQTIEHNDTPVIRGMIQKVFHLVKVEQA